MAEFNRDLGGADGYSMKVGPLMKTVEPISSILLLEVVLVDDVFLPVMSGGSIGDWFSVDLRLGWSG